MLKATEDIRKETTNEWISVKDRLPESYEDVLVYDKYYGIIIPSYHDEKAFYREDENRSDVPLLYVTHWMKLPEKPKE